MKLSDLFLNRWLYKDVNQNLETKDSVFDSSNVIPADVPSVAAGSSAQDINTSNVTINGQQITPGTLVLTVGDWGWGQTCVFSSTTLNKVSWTGGNFKTASGTILTISAGDTTARLTAAGLTSPMNAKVYIYLDLNISDDTYQCTYTPGDSVGLGKVLIAVAKNDTVSATFNTTEANQIIGDNILANTINAGKLSVGQLSAITADLGAITAGSITMDTLGFIRGGQTGYNTGTGFFIGYSSSAYKLSMGNGSTKLFTYDGTDLTLLGGTITGGIIRTAATGTRVEMNNSGVWANSLAFFYGADANPNGQIYASSGTFNLFNPVSGGAITAATADGVLWSGVGAYFSTKNHYPWSAGNYDLGSNSYYWRDLHAYGVAYLGSIYSGNILPTSSGDHNLGSSSYYWDWLYNKRIEFLSFTSDPGGSTYGQMWHFYNTLKQFRGTPYDTTVLSFDMSFI